MCMSYFDNCDSSLAFCHLPAIKNRLKNPTNAHPRRCRGIPTAPRGPTGLNEHNQALVQRRIGQAHLNSSQLRPSAKSRHPKKSSTYLYENTQNRNEKSPSTRLSSADSNLSSTPSHPADPPA